MYMHMGILKVIARSAFAGAGKAASIVAIAIFGASLQAASTPTLANGTFSSDSQQSSAALDLRIIIPPILRILENNYPRSLPAADTQTSRISALQRMVLVSTLPKGFCMDLQLTQRQVTDWQLHVSGSAGAWIQSSEGGYRLCAGRAGRYEVALHHDFSLRDSMRGTMAPALDWPVHLSLTTP
ncbi:hypothetical protein LP414_19115 [Polaromonas sp. P1(28)-13]|nr:hypothetical protein LP414_19115 [Polaromonas sp. P1(28)-13]